MNAIIFARVSSKDQEDGQSIPAQVRRLTEYASRKNLIIESTLQVTESSSKETRKQFGQIITHIKKSKKPYAIIVDTVDRLQRSFRETPVLEELCKQGKLELHFLREGLIINQQANSSQLMQWDMGVLAASSYVRQMSDNIKRSQEECIRNGQWISKAPYGYKNISLPCGKKAIEVDQERAPFAIKIFQEYAKGNNSFQTIAAKMKAAGFPLTSRGKSITHRTVELILKNPFYIGLMFIKGQLRPHKYPTLISESLFNTVQQVIANHHKAPVQYAGKPILLRGLISCKNCQSTVSGDIKKGKYVYYSCHNSKRVCIKKWVKEELLLESLLKNFDRIHLTDEYINQIMDSLQEYEGQRYESTQNAKRFITEKLDAIKSRISKLIDLRVDDKIDAESYQSKLTEYKKEQSRLSSELKSYEESGGEPEFITAQHVLELARNAKSIFMSSKLAEKQQLLNFFFSNLQLDRENLDVELRLPFNLLANVHDQHVWRS